MAAMERTEIIELYEKLYEQNLVFLALRTSPEEDTALAETRNQIMQIYGRIQALL